MDEWIRSTFKSGSLQANAGWETRDCRPRHLRQHTCTRTLAPSHPSHPGTPWPWTAVNWAPSNHQPHGQEAGARPLLAWRECGCDGMARGELWQVGRCVAAGTAGHERALRWRAARVVTRPNWLPPKKMELGRVTANPATYPDCPGLCSW